jgi:pyrimidine operon attenuation protein/uracil phosphoribosyltransferase
MELGFGPQLKYGELDATFHRDDFRRGEILTPSENNINFIVENTHVVLVDDVLYTGRTVRAALDALNSYGRPKKVELLALVDRLYSREIPISANYVGISVDTRANDKVKVIWNENKKDNQVLILTQQI